MTSERKEKLACREASSMEELATLLKLRDPDFRLDVYDLKSWHLGLFLEQGSWSEPIGYLRAVENHGIADWRMRQLAIQHPEAHVDPPDDPASLPILNDWPDPDSLNRFYDRQAGIDRRVVEATCLTLVPGYDELGFDLFLIESAVAMFFFALCADTALMATPVMSRERYERFGFEIAEGTREVRKGSRGDWEVCLVATPDRVKPLLHPRILDQAHLYRAEERITMDLREWIGAVA